MSKASSDYTASFRNLIVYQKSRAVAKEAFKLSCSLPRDEDYSLKDQLRRASRSIGAQIAESWAKRRYERHFVSKLSDADAEQMETQHWIEICGDCGYGNETIRQTLIEQLEEIGRMLNGMMNKADAFCGKTPLILREGRAEYFTAKS